MVDQGLFLIAGQQAPAAGAPTVPAFNEAEHEFIHTDLGSAYAGPGFGQEGDAAIGGRIALVEKLTRRSGAADDAGDRGNVDDHTISTGLQVGQGFFEDPSFGPQAGVDFEVPLFPHVRPMNDGPATSLDIVDQDVEAAEALDRSGDQLLDLAPQDDGTYDLDFNLAYAPFCAYSPAYSCPLPPMENWLTARIEAGERNPPGGQPT